MFNISGLLRKVLLIFLFFSDNFAYGALNISFELPVPEKAEHGAGVKCVPTHHSRSVTASVNIIEKGEIISDVFDLELVAKSTFIKFYKEHVLDDKDRDDYIQFELIANGETLAKAHNLPNDAKGVINCIVTSRFKTLFNSENTVLNNATVTCNCFNGWPDVDSSGFAGLEANSNSDYAWRLPIDKSSIRQAESGGVFDRFLGGFKAVLGMKDDSWKSSVVLCPLDKENPLYSILLPRRVRGSWQVVLPRSGFTNEAGPFSYVGDNDRYLNIGENLFVDLALCWPCCTKVAGQVSTESIDQGAWFDYQGNIPCFGSEKSSLAAKSNHGNHDKEFNILLMGELRHLQFKEKEGNKYDLTLSNISNQLSSQRLYSAFSISYRDPDLDGCNTRKIFGNRPAVVPNNVNQVIDLVNMKPVKMIASQRATEPGDKRFAFLGVVDVVFQHNELIVRGAGRLQEPHSFEIDGFGKVQVTCRASYLDVEITTSWFVDLVEVIPEGDPSSEIYSVEHKALPASLSPDVKFSDNDVRVSLLGAHKNSSRRFSKRNDPT